MQEDEPLPVGLTQIEQEIGSSLRFQSPAGLDRRMIHAMRAEIRIERSAARWRFALGLAAVAFVWLHLSFYVAPATHFHTEMPANGRETFGDGPFSAWDQEPGTSGR